MNDYAFGNFLYTLRTEKGLSQVELGELLGVTEIEHGAFAGCSALEEVVFADPNGWKVHARGWSGESKEVDVSDPGQNATFFTGEYCEYYWNKKTSSQK